MGAFGGSGGGTSQNASSKAYIPQAQGTADAGYQGLTHTLFDQATAGLGSLGGITPAGAVYPQVQQTTQNVLQNPYAPQYVQGGQNAYDFFQQGQMPNIYQGSQQLAGLANLAAGAGSNPNYASANAAGYNLSGPMQGGVMQLLGDIFNPQYQSAIDAGNTAAGKQFGAGDAIRTQAFDPQNALYNRTQARLSDQIGAGNANSGLAGTPYGESVRGNALGNFNIDWQNQQLQRMMQGGTAASGLDTAGIAQMLNPSSTASSVAASDLGAAGSGVASALQALISPANAQTNALGVATGAANTGFQGANSLLGQGSAGMNQYAGLPYQNLNTTQGNNFGALQNQISLGNQNYALPQQVLNDLQSYLGLGQSASGYANNIGTTNFNQLAQGASGAGQLLGGANSLFGGGGGSAAASGLGNAGFLGAQGPIFGSAADASIAAGGPPLAAGGGIGDVLGAFAPAALSA